MCVAQTVRGHSAVDAGSARGAGRRSCAQPRASACKDQDAVTAARAAVLRAPHRGDGAGARAVAAEMMVAPRRSNGGNGTGARGAEARITEGICPANHPTGIRYKANGWKGACSDTRVSDRDLNALASLSWANK